MTHAKKISGASGVANPNLPIPFTSLDDVHIWRIALTQSESVISHLRAMLSHEEQFRAQQFLSDKMRRQYIVSHGVLRHVLSRYLGIPAMAVPIMVDKHGKPRIAAASLLGDTPKEKELNSIIENQHGNFHPSTGRPSLSFNLSHSGDWALIALTRRHNVGIDVERIRPLDNYMRIAARFFSPMESAALRALPPEKQLNAFYACWTRKEAYIKARGDAFRTRILSQFAVSLAPDEPPALLHVAGDSNKASRWTLQDICVGTGYAAALAAQGDPPLTLTLLDWNA